MSQRRNDSWFILASDELGVPGSVLRDYAAHGDNLSLAILIHIIHRQFDHFGKSSWPGIKFSLILETASKFNAQDTSPELQHEFCALWNQIVLNAKKDNSQAIVAYILRPIRNVYIAVHQDTVSAPTRFSASTGNWDDILFWQSSYPVCNVAGHIHNDSASTTYARTSLHKNAALVLASLASPDPPSSSVLVPLRVDEGFMDVPPLANDVYVPRSFHPAHKTAIETLRIPATSQDPVTTHAIQGGIDISITTIPHFTPEPLASTQPPTSIVPTSPLGAVAVQHITERRTSSDVLDVPSLPSPTPVLNNMLHTGPQSSLNSPVTRSDHASSFPESHSSLLAPAAPNRPRPRQSSALDLGAAAEGEGSAKAALHKERDALDPASAILENIIAPPDLPPQSLSPSSVTDVAIAGPSRCSLGAEHTGDHPPHTSHGQYDIV